MEAFLAGLIGFLIGRGIPRKDAESIVKALRELLGFEPPVGLTGYSVKDMEKNGKYKASVVVRGKAYDAIALEDIKKHEAISVLSKTGAHLEVARVITINIMEIPKSSSQVIYGLEEVPSQEEETTIGAVEGAGFVSHIRWTTGHDKVVLTVYCDGNLAESLSPQTLNTLGHTANTPVLPLKKYAPAGTCAGIFNVPFQFQRKCEVKAHQLTGAPVIVACYGTVALVT